MDPSMLDQDSPIDPLYPGPDDTVKLRAFHAPAEQHNPTADRSQRRHTFDSERTFRTDAVTCFRVEIGELCRQLTGLLERAGPDVVVSGLLPGQEIGTQRQWGTWMFAFHSLENEEVKALFEVIEDENEAELTLGMLYRGAVPLRRRGIDDDTPSSAELAYVRMIVLDCRETAISSSKRYSQVAGTDEGTLVPSRRPPSPPPQAFRRAPSPSPEPSMPPLAANLATARGHRLTLPPSYVEFTDPLLLSPVPSPLGQDRVASHSPAVRFEPQRRAPDLPPPPPPNPERIQRRILAILSSATSKTQTIHSTTLRSFARHLNPFRGSESRGNTPSTSSQVASGQVSPAVVDLASDCHPYVPPRPVQPSASKSVAMSRETAEVFSSADGWRSDFQPLFTLHRCTSFRMASPSPIPLQFWCNGRGEESQAPCLSHLSMNLNVSDLEFTQGEVLHMTRAGPEEMSSMVGEKFRRSLRFD